MFKTPIRDAESAQKVEIPNNRTFATNFSRYELSSSTGYSRLMTVFRKANTNILHIADTRKKFSRAAVHRR